MPITNGSAPSLIANSDISTLLPLKLTWVSAVASRISQNGISAPPRRAACVGVAAAQHQRRIGEEYAEQADRGAEGAKRERNHHVREVHDGKAQAERLPGSPRRR